MNIHFISSPELRARLLSPGSFSEFGGLVAMNETRYTENHVRSLSAIVAEIKEEVKDFVQTRVEMFKSEVRETLNAWKTAVPLALIAVLLLATAYLLITLAVVGLVAVAFWDNPYRWFLAFLIVGVVWSLGGGVLGWLALR